MKQFFEDRPIYVLTVSRNQFVCDDWQPAGHCSQVAIDRIKSCDTMLGL